MENKYAGMTVNERLFLSRLMDEFDECVKAKDVDKIRSILEKVELSEESLKSILEHLVH